MKAIRVHSFGEPEVMRLEEVPEPQPGPGQVLVKVQAAGVNPVDTYIRAGAYAAAAALPYTPGMDAAGVVEAVGAGVKAVAPGDRVYTSGSVSGAYAEKTLCLESQVHPLPPQVTFAQGAGVNVPYAAAYRALLQRARAAPGEVVLVHGASGGVGVAATQLA
ncbi:MAG: alcohol dehydrogenase catalytic domain-containing protein, partial [Desulfobaccales bacterium]